MSDLEIWSELHSDADWVAPRSQSGFLSAIVCGPGVDEAPSGFLPLHYGSRKQPLTADSSTSAEIIAAHFAVREGAPILLQFRELQLTSHRKWQTQYNY